MSVPFSPSLLSRDHVRAWIAMGDVGKVRRHKDGRTYLEFPGKRRLWSLPVPAGRPLPFDRRLAQRTLERIRGELSQGERTLDEILARFQPMHAEANLVHTRLERWLRVKRREVAAGDRSRTYLRELERWCQPDGQF